MEKSMGKRTYIYHKETANGQTTLVTSNGGHPIPSDSEVVMEFPGSLSDTEIESRLKKISNGERGYHTMGLKRYVLIGGEKISVKIAQSYRENPSQGKPFSLQVQQWLEGKISQTGEKIMPTSSAPQPAYLAQPMDTIPPFTASTGPKQSKGEYVIDFNAMQEEIETKVAGLSKALHKAKKKRAFPTTAADLDREDTRNAEEYSNDCKSLATQICQRALQELQKGPGADKILILFPRGEKGQPDGKIVQKKPIQDLWGKHHRRTV
ncbi:hypothetical protein [Legionella drancourtii]|nr:hypothetical protein [Legionella drancourtii]